MRRDMWFSIMRCLTWIDADEPVQPPLKLRNSKCCSVSSRIFKRLAKALIRLRVCPVWSEPLLVVHTTLLEISCRGSNCFWACLASCIYTHIDVNDVCGRPSLSFDTVVHVVSLQIGRSWSQIGDKAIMYTITICHIIGKIIYRTRISFSKKTVASFSTLLKWVVVYWLKKTVAIWK